MKKNKNSWRKLNSYWEREDLLHSMHFKKNIYVFLIFSLLWTMLFFAVMRIAFYFYNTEYFPDMTLARFLAILRGGVFFDLTAVLYTNSVFIILILLPANFRFTGFYKIVLKSIFIITNGIALLANGVDIVYYRFTLRRTTASVFSQFANEQNLGKMFRGFLIDYWYVAVFYIFMMAIFIYVWNKTKYDGPQIKNKRLYYISCIIAIPVAAMLFFGGTRSTFRYNARPITLGTAGQFVSIPRDANLVLNTPFAIYRTLDKPVLLKVDYYNDIELEKIYTPVHKGGSGEFKNLNVVIIILESFSREYIGAFNRELDGGNYQGFTPFLDSLIGESKTYFYGFSNGRESMDAPVSILASIPKTYIDFSKSHYAVNEINGLGKLLKNKGYHTSFFHGAHNGTMNFDSFVKLAGYENYFGKDEYEREHGTGDFDGIWGVWDEEFFRFFAHKVSAFPQPFHSVLFSVSSHSPFAIPEKYRNIYKEEQLPIHKTIRYTDSALKIFFEAATKTNWFKNTLFVITADHCSALVNFKEYRNSCGAFLIPVVFYYPQGNLKGMENNIAQQLDIMPTVLDFLNYDKHYVAFGQNLFNPSEERLVFNYLDNMYQLFAGDYLLLFDGEQSKALYNFKTDVFLKKNVLNDSSETGKIMERKIKAIIQQYNNRMVDGSLIPEK